MARVKLNELQNKIVTVCISCNHSRFVGGHFECDRKRSECHSPGVRRWLSEIKKLEVKDGTRQGQSHS